MVATLGPFPNNLRVLRYRKGLNQRQASEQLDIHRNRLSQMESGRELPTWETAKQLMAFYGAALSEIFPNPLQQQIIAESGTIGGESHRGNA